MKTTNINVFVVQYWLKIPDSWHKNFFIKAIDDIYDKLGQFMMI